MIKFEFNNSEAMLLDNIKHSTKDREIQEWFANKNEEDPNLWDCDTAQLVIAIAKENFEQLLLTFVLLLYMWVAKL